MIAGVFLLPWVTLLESQIQPIPFSLRESPGIQLGMQATTLLGLGWVDIGLFIVLLVVGWGRQWPEGRRVGLYGALTVSGAGLAHQLVKSLICRARPNAAGAGLFFAKFQVATGEFNCSSRIIGDSNTGAGKTRE